MAKEQDICDQPPQAWRRFPAWLLLTISLPPPAQPLLLPYKPWGSCGMYYVPLQKAAVSPEEPEASAHSSHSGTASLSQDIVNSLCSMAGSVLLQPLLPFSGLGGQFWLHSGRKRSRIQCFTAWPPLPFLWQLLLVGILSALPLFLEKWSTGHCFVCCLVSPRAF